MNEGNSKFSISQIADTLFAWLGQWVQGKGVPPESVKCWSDREWRIVKSVTIIHGMGPLWGALIIHGGLKCKIPAFFVDHLKNQYMGNRKRVVMLTQAAETLFGLLEQRGIAYVPLKGIALAERLYPEPGLRPMSDIDIYTAPESTSRISELMAEQGFIPHSVESKGATYYPDKFKEVSGLSHDISWKGSCAVVQKGSAWLEGESPELPYSIDVHYSMNAFSKGCRYDLTEEFDQANRSGKELSDEIVFIYLLLHAAKHMYEERARWTHLYDIYLFQQKTELDIEYIIFFAKERKYSHLLLLPLVLCRKTFAMERGKLEKKLQQNVDLRFKLLINRVELAENSCCNPWERNMLSSLLWVHNANDFFYWFKDFFTKDISLLTSDTNSIRSIPNPIARLVGKIQKRLKKTPRRTWQIFDLQNLDPGNDWR